MIKKIKEIKIDTVKEIAKEFIKDNIDEKSIIIEQDRQKREQKKRKNRKKKRIIIAMASLLAIGGISYAYWGKNLQTTVNQNKVEIVAGVGQDIIFAQLNQVNGNEITYTIAEKGEDADAIDSSEDETMGSSKGINVRNKRNDQNSGNTEFRQSGGPRGQGIPDGAEGFIQGEILQQSGGVVEGEMPQQAGSFVQGGMPDMEDGFIMEGGTVFGDNISTTDSFTYNGATYNLTEKSNTTYIPVGTDVTTKLGAITTFSRLAAGDNVALVVINDGEEQIIVGIYIIG